jgi:hypothetical protein
VMGQFRLPVSFVKAAGGGKSRISAGLDADFQLRGWTKKHFDSSVQVDGQVHENPTHEIDCYKNRVGLEVEWNNKDTFYDRDLNNFRILFDIDAISVGVIITKSESLKQRFRELGVYAKFGPSTTWMGKLLPRAKGGGAGGCPLLVVGIGPSVLRL